MCSPKPHRIPFKAKIKKQINIVKNKIAEIVRLSHHNPIVHTRVYVIIDEISTANKTPRFVK